MKRFLSTLILVLALFVGASTAYAVDGVDAVDLTAVADAADAEAAVVDAALAKAAAETPANPATAADAKNAQYNFVMEMIMSLFAWLVGVAAITLDYSVYYTVITMGNYIHNLAAVGVAWRILRDIGNIMLIFGFLAVGITTILNVDWYGSGKKMLPMLFVAAIFLNFSLFISEAIIDTGNLFATQFYKQINGGTLPTQASLSATTIQNEGISTKIMSQLGLQSIYNVNDGKVNKTIFSGTSPWLIGFMGILLFIVTAFVMFSLAFILIARFVALIFLIILAPIGFAGLAVPMLKGQADKWWSKLFEQTITAPILLLMLYIALAVITDAHFLTGFSSAPGGWLGFVNNNNLAGFGGTVLSFLVAMGLLLAVTIQAKNLSAFGAGWATKTAGALTFGATAWGVNRTLGRGAYFASRGLRQSKVFNKVNALTGRVMSGTLDRAAKASFDVRGATIGGGLKGLGVEAGEARKGGFIEARKQGIKEHEEEAKRIEEAHKEAFEETAEEKEAAKEAAATLKRAKEGHGETTKEYWAALQEVRDRQAEVKRIEEEKVSTPDKDARLAAARDDLQASAKKRDDLKDNIGRLDEVVKNLTKAEEVASKAGETRLKADIKGSKIAYAEGIDHPVWNVISPINLVSYGPGAGAAAQKIKESLKEKPTKDKFLELAQKMAKELGETETKKEEPKEAGKPEDTH